MLKSSNTKRIRAYANMYERYRVAFKLLNKEITPHQAMYELKDVVTRDEVNLTKMIRKELAIITVK